VESVNAANLAKMVLRYSGIPTVSGEHFFARINRKRAFWNLDHAGVLLGAQCAVAAR
jgi:hypothetical protein